MTDARKDIDTIANNVQQLQLGINLAATARQDQVVTLNLGVGMDTAAIQKRSDVATEEVLQATDDQEFVLSPEFRFRLFLERKLIVAIAQITSALYAFYTPVEASVNGLSQHFGADAIELELPELISYLRANKSLRPRAPLDEEDMDYLQRLENLNEKAHEISQELNSMMRSREQLLDHSNAGPDTEMIRGLILEAGVLRAHFLGSLVGMTVVFGASPHDLAQWLRNNPEDS